MSLNLKIRGPTSPGATSIVVSSSSTWADFVALLKKELKLSGDFDVLCGFPAVPAEFSDNQILGDVIKSNESLRVQLKSVSGLQAKGESKIKPNKKASKSSATSNHSTAPAFGARIVGLKHAPNKASFLSSSPAKRSAAVSGLAQDTSASKRRRKSSSSNKISSEGDIAEHLVSAVNGGTGVQNRAARKVFRNAVLHQYNSTQAVSRVNATYSGQFSIRECGGVLLSTAASSSSARPTYTHIEATYHKGAGSRGHHVDTVELLSKELLVGVLRMAVQRDPPATATTAEEGGGDNDDNDDREALKPMNLARCSPRIFWSLVHHFGADVAAGIRTALRGIDDCTWLDERKRELSEKARLNQQQKAELDARKKPRKGAAAAFNIAKEEAVDKPASPAAQQVGQPATGSAVPTDPLQIWLIDKVQANLPLADFVPTEWQSAVSAHCASLATATGGSTVLQLASLKPSSRLCDALERCRMEQSTGKSSSSAAAVDAVKAGAAAAGSLSVGQLEAWVTSVRVAAFHSVWRTLCGGGSERLRRALHGFRVRRPRNLRMWRAAPEGLLQGLLDRDAALASGVAFHWPAGTGTGAGAGAMDGSCDDQSGLLDSARVGWMCQLALAASAVFPWVDGEDICETAHSSDVEPDDDAQVRHGQGKGQGEEGQEGGAGEGDDDEPLPWLYEETAHEHMHRRVRLEVNDSGGYWEDGSVVAYLPPDAEESMALWRIKLDPPGAGAGRQQLAGATQAQPVDRFEDLEKHELLEAIERLANKDT